MAAVKVLRASHNHYDTGFGQPSAFPTIGQPLMVNSPAPPVSTPQQLQQVFFDKQHITSCNTERLNDVFYEPIYHYSSAHDHARRVGIAFNSAPVTHLISSKAHHFGAIPSHYMPHCGVARNINFLPRNVHAEFPQQVHVTSITEPWDVTGRNSYKYLYKPLIPYLPGGQQRVLARLIDDIRQFNSKEVLIGDATSQRTTGCQTDYRDDEAQTEPYTPPTRVVLGGGGAAQQAGDGADYAASKVAVTSEAAARAAADMPEVLRLAHMTIANRWLPVDINAVEFVERMRRKQEWERSLPPITDLEQMPKRLRLMEKMERDEWTYREQRFAKLQKIQRKAIDAMKARVRDYEERVNTKRMKMVWQEKITTLTKTKSDIARGLARDMRKILDGYKQRQLKCSYKKDIVRDYINFGSHIYAPLMRHGLIRDHVPKRFVAGDAMSNYDRIVNFEKQLHMQVLDKLIPVPVRPSAVNKKGFVRREYRHDQALERARIDNEAQRQARLQGGDRKREPLRLKERVEHIEPRPPTPLKCREYSRNEELFELAVIFLQKVLRGRVVQNQMHEGLAKRRELLAEIRTTHALQESEKVVKEQLRIRVLNEQLSEEYIHMQEQYVEQGIQQLEGESLSVFMEFLNKELLRVREERRLHAFAWLALRQRRLRECREAGRRQVELRRRQEEEEIFRQMSQVHNDTLDDYLSNIVAASEATVSRELATVQIMQKGRQVADVGSRAKKQQAYLEDDARGLITQMLYEFMLPQTHRRLQQRDADAILKSRLEAAHLSMVEAVKNVSLPPSPLSNASAITNAASDSK